MGRKSTFKDAEVFAAVGTQIALNGSLTLHELTNITGLSTGSLYHRFSSREALMAQTWLNAVRLFQTEFLEALQRPTLDAGERAALATPRFCRAHPSEAVVLASCRKEEFLGSKTPSDQVEEIATVNDEVAAEFSRFARRINKPLLVCRLAIVAYPLAAVRLYLPHKPVPKSIDAEILKAYKAALAPPHAKT